MFGVCSNAQKKDDVVLRILYFRDIEGAPEMWEMHTGYVRYQDMSEPSIAASAPLSEEDQKRLQDAFDAVRLDSLEKNYEGTETNNAPGLVFNFIPTRTGKRLLSSVPSGMKRCCTFYK